jgi:hypothetical protein
MNQSRNLRTVCALSSAAALAWLASAALAAPIVNDTWLDGSDAEPAAPVFSENGFDADGDGNLESAWFQGGVGSLDPVGAGGPLRGDLTAGGTSSASWTTYFTPEGSPITLAQGDRLRVTWAFTPTNVNTSNTRQNFRLALVDTPAAARITVNSAPGSAAYTGYGMFMNMGQTLGNANPFRLMERAVASGAMLSASGDWAPLANGATSGNAGYASGTEYTFVMELFRNLSDEMEINVSMSGGTLDNDGTASVVFTDTTPNLGSFTFDTFSVRPSGATTTAELFDTRLFQVDYTPVPEPTAVGAILLTSAAVMIRRRRA